MSPHGESSPHAVFIRVHHSEFTLKYWLPAQRWEWEREREDDSNVVLFIVSSTYLVIVTQSDAPCQSSPVASLLSH